MKMFMLDNSVVYSQKFRSYNFPTQYGDRPYYIRVKEGVEPEGIECTLPDESFNLIRNKRGVQFVPAEDRSQRAAVFISFNGSSYEEVEPHEEFSTARTFYKYYASNSMGTQLKVLAIIQPRRPLVIKYTNKLTGSVRVEYVVYNAHKKIIERKSVDPDSWKALRKDTEIVDDYEYEIPAYFTEKYLAELSEDEKAKLELWKQKYYSPLKDA